MSRNQWIVILVLSVAAAVVLGCLRALALPYLIQGFPTQPLVPVQAIDTSIPAPLDTPIPPTSTSTAEPTPTPTIIALTATPEPPTPTNTRVLPPTAAPIPQGSDMAYLRCMELVMADSIILMDDLVFTLTLGSEEPAYFCVFWTVANHYPTALSIKRRGSACPIPSTPCVLESRALVLSAFDQQTNAITLVDGWCATGDISDFSPLQSYIVHMDQANLLMTQAARVLETCGVQ